jgi:hypothetical protein
MSHLVGTRDLLHGAGYPACVCDAGLLHSIYGTNKFNVMSLDPETPGARDRVRAVVGVLAEQLAFLFHAINRPQVHISE